VCLHMWGYPFVDGTKKVYPFCDGHILDWHNNIEKCKAILNWSMWESISNKFLWKTWDYVITTFKWLTNWPRSHRLWQKLLIIPFDIVIYERGLSKQKKIKSRLCNILKSIIFDTLIQILVIYFHKWYWLRWHQVDMEEHKR
jgi:hypothetical protein